MARNNFSSSAIGGDCMVVPARQVSIEDDAHICQEVCGDFFAFDVDPAEHLDHYLRPGGCFGLCHEVPGNVHRVKRHALAGARYMGKQALVNTSRPALIDTGALVSAFEQGQPGFAALDVEPLPGESPTD